MKKLLIVLMASFIGQGASAQLSVSPEIGYQFSKTRYEIAGARDNGAFKQGIRAGASIGLGVMSHFELRGGAFFSGKGGKADFLGSDVSHTINYIDIPVFLNYITGKAMGNRFFIGAGPYWAYTIGGSSKALGIKRDLEIGSQITDDVKPMDFGLNANAGFILFNGIYIKGMYAHGLKNILPAGNSNNSIRNATLSVSLGYNYVF
ncbi:MAG: porin family protein [Chitinophagaceae bacterium]|jgi:hypothetical protein